MKHVFIVNPTSGGGIGLEIAKNIEKICTEKNLEYIMHFTSASKEATLIARTYKRKEYIIYSVGGDGTLSEVLNGIVGTKNKLAVIPAGHGNDFYKSIQNLDGTEKRIDIGKINKTYFINVVSFGIDAEVGNNANLFKNNKLIPKGQIYNASIIYTLFKYKHQKIKFALNNITMYGKYTIVAICNGSFYGNGYNIGPTAKLDDGLFDVYYVSKLSKSVIIKLVPKLKNGKHENDPRVNKKQVKSIKIRTNSNIVCNIDGEILICNKFKIKIIPSAITIHNDKDLINKFLTF